MDFTAEEKAKMEVPIKNAMLSILEALDIAGDIVVAKTGNKIDDIVYPIAEPMAKAALVSLINGIKL